MDIFKEIFDQFHDGNELSEEEKEKYLGIISKIKEIENTVFPVDGKYKADIVSLRLQDYEEFIHVNGFISVGKENRLIDSYITTNDDGYSISTHVLRIMNKGKNKEYDTKDEIKNNTRKTKYSFSDIVFDEEIEGKEKRI